MRIYYGRFVWLLGVALLMMQCEDESRNDSGGRAYYINAAGNDADDGSKASPWKTLTRLNAISLHAGDTVYLEGGQVFTGTLQLDSGDSGDETNPVVITSSGTGKARVDAGNSSAIIISYARFINVSNLHLIGSGRKDGNTTNGLAITNTSSNIELDSVEIEGFQKAGLLVYASSDILINRIYAHENGYAGISIEGFPRTRDARNIKIANCLAENNPGDPTILNNHSGNGIIAGFCKNVTIEYCVATNNGWDMPRIGNGPVGIWAYEADSVFIQHCISYRNKTSVGGEDGGGFDLDGGITNSIIQYCLSYENQGSGFGLFQYASASPWHNNIIRFNISENDGLVSTAHAGIYIWNASDDENKFSDCFIYNNVVYNTPGAAISFSVESKRKNFFYYNNILVGGNSIITGISHNDIFKGNNWWSLTSQFRINNFTDFETWATQTNQEKINGELAGVNINPAFTEAGNTTLTLPAELKDYVKYRLPVNSPLHASGLDLKEMGIDTGSRDFNGNAAPPKGVGASF